MSAAPLPESFGRNGAYKVVSIIGRGGFATVYKAYHAALDRHVAIKVLRPEMVEPEGARMRFQIEARASARLAGHPNIVTVYDYGEEEGSAYLVLQLVDGMPLDKRLATPITAAEIDTIITGTASALDFAHRNSLIHRDIKPSNVLLEQDGTPILSDFGIAKLLDATASMTNTLLGTPDYMSPEQITGSPLDGRSDVYALGVMIYRIFAGKTPYQGVPMSILHQHVHSPVPPIPPNPLTGRPVPAAVEQVIQRALAKYPEQRQATAGQLADELRAALRPQILADRAQEALQASDVTRAEGLAAELLREHPSYPEGSLIQQEIARRRARIAQRARVAAFIDAEQWQAAVDEIGRLGLRADTDTSIVELVRQADAGLSAERSRQEAARQEAARQEAARQETARRAEQERQRREYEARETARREQEAREAAWREQQAREAAQREADARDAARREQEARETARREQEAREAAWREQQAREAAWREQQAREQQAREASQREAEARDAEQRRQQAEAAERQRQEREQADHERHRRAQLEALERQVDQEAGLSPAEVSARAAERAQRTRALQAPGVQAPEDAAEPRRSPATLLVVGVLAAVVLIGGGLLFGSGALTAVLGSASEATPVASQPAATPPATSAPATTAPVASASTPAAKPTTAPTTPPTVVAQKPVNPPPSTAAPATTAPATATAAPAAPTSAPVAKPETKPEPPTATPAPPTPAPAPLPTRIPWDDSVEMALVPAGEFAMGQDGEPSTAPRHALTLPDFYIDLTEVTNDRFARYVQATGAKPEGDWLRYADPTNFDARFYDVQRAKHPVVNVTWNDANNYCSWAGKRLPYEAEWEKAARGTDARRWPWGNEPHPEFANVENQSEGEPDTKNVGSLPRGASPFGLLDMIGNVREWTDSSFLPYPLTQPTTGADGGTSRVTRGGSWLSLPGSIELTKRLAEPISAAAKDLGFRCAVSADQARGR
ncbi:MAG: SUMF1/EgtB/PvdO family nonheme iron enzyme [Chloroflexota bacterium]